MDGLKKFKSLGIFLGIIILIVGVIFLVFSSEVVKILAWIIGAGMLITGLIRFIQGLKTTGQTGTNHGARMVLGAVMVGIGLYLIIDNNAAIGLVGIVIALFAFAAAFDRFTVAHERHKMEQKVGVTVAFGIVHVLFGILMIYASVAMVTLIVTLTGLYLLAAGIMVIISAGYLFDFE